ETLLAAPVALFFLAWLDVQGAGSFGRIDRWTDLLLVAASIFTALPLLWFANAAKRLRLSTVGMFQYIAPTVNFLLAVFVYGETFTMTHACTFGLIWIALALFTADAFRAQRRLRQLQKAQTAIG